MKRLRKLFTPTQRILILGVILTAFTLVIFFIPNTKKSVSAPISQKIDYNSWPSDFNNKKEVPTGEDLSGDALKLYYVTYKNTGIQLFKTTIAYPDRLEKLAEFDPFIGTVDRGWWSRLSVENGTFKQPKPYDTPRLIIQVSERVNNAFEPRYYLLDDNESTPPIELLFQNVKEASETRIEILGWIDLDRILVREIVLSGDKTKFTSQYYVAPVTDLTKKQVVNIN